MGVHPLAARRGRGRARASSLARWQHGLEQLSAPLLLLEIVEAEAGSKLPGSGRNGARVGLANDGGGSARACPELGLLVSAILAQIERPRVRASPLDRAVEVDRDILLGADRAGPIDAHLILLFRPLGALVREIEWIVVANGDDQVLIRDGQLERWESMEYRATLAACVLQRTGMRTWSNPASATSVKSSSRSVISPLPFLRGIERIAPNDAPAQATRLFEGRAPGGLQVIVSRQRRGHHRRLRSRGAGDRQECNADTCQ